MGGKDVVLNLLEGERAQASLPHQCILGKPQAALTSHPQGPLEGTSQSFGQMPVSGKQQPSHPTAFQLRTPPNVPSPSLLRPFCLLGWLTTAHPPSLSPGCPALPEGGALPWHHTPSPVSCPNLPSSLLSPPESPQCYGCVAFCPAPFPASLRREPNCDPSWLERQGGGQSLGEWRSLGSVLCWHLTDSCFSRAKEPPATPSPASCRSPPPTLLPLNLSPPPPLTGRAESLLWLLHSPLLKKHSPVSVPWATPCLSGAEPSPLGHL